MILIINDHSIVEGGASKVAITQAKDLLKENKSVIFFSTYETNCFNDIKNNTNFIHETFFWRDNIFFSFFNMLFNISAFMKLRNILNKHQITNIYVHSWSKKLSPSIFLALKNNFFHMFLHDYFLSCPNGGLYNFQKKEHCQLRPLSISCVTSNCDKRNYLHKVFRVIRQFIYKLCISGSNTEYIFLSERQKNIINLSGPVLRNKIETVDISERYSFEFNNDILFLGRLDPEKGIAAFLDLDISKKHIINVVGDGMLKSDLSSKSHVSIKGWLDFNDAMIEAKKNRFAIFTSVWHEVDPLTPWELMAAGMPVLTSDNNLFGQELKHIFPELVFSFDDVAGIESKINQLNNDKFFKELSYRIYEFSRSEITKRNSNWKKFIKNENLY